MSNQQLIKKAHVWALALILAGGLWAVAGKAGIRLQGQNSNQNQNQNQNGNTNANTNTSSNSNRQSSNANRSNRNSRNDNASGQQAGMGNLSSRDREFLMDAAMDGLMEVELGRLATQQGSSDAVKQFGQRMVDDHSKANEELMTLASSKGITLPTTLGEKHRDHVTKLQGLSGTEFDRAYAKEMLNGHNKDVAEFERQSTRGSDPDLKAFAARTLPILQEHQQMARTLPGNEGRGNSNMNRSGNRNDNNNSNRSNRNGNNNSNRP